MGRVTTIVVKRFAELARIHPSQRAWVCDDWCDDCGASVGIPPSGQNAIMADPTTIVLCGDCYGRRRLA